ncbi:hypothetical protein TRICI_001908 [Trichomonascus ciferrii]|uniref:Zn(2)-C6 fungal-type domain-containing protein n=1 Tax=Trichomonascus ciferrii TaxID=44093 RepID=A0A642VCB0_9ASCO|nr:hypothetical protein TRICI_001908 [Trichomonascus ciferrii]
MKRKRTKVSCIPCHEQKRKCDKMIPCGTCVKGKRTCYYENTGVSQPEARRKNEDNVHGVLAIHNNGWSKYTSGTFWANIGSMHTNVADYLNDNEEGSAFLGSGKKYYSLFFDSPGVVPPLKEELMAVIPPEDHGNFLLDRFEMAVNSIFPLCDVATVRERYQRVQHENDYSVLSLLFAVFYAASFSLEVGTTPSFIPSDKGSLQHVYFSALEQSLRALGFPHTCTLQSLQACVIFELCNMQEHSSLSPMVPVLVRQAQTMGLHRDGELFELEKCVVKERRMTWWNIVFLDWHDSSCRDLNPLIRGDEYDTKFPEKDCVATIISNCRVQSLITSSGVLRKLYGLNRCSYTDFLKTQEMISDHDAMCERTKQDLEQYDTLAAKYGSAGMKTLIHKLKLLTAPYYAKPGKAHVTTCEDILPLLDSAVEYIDALAQLYTNNDFKDFMWFTKNFQPFHAVTLILSYIYRYPNTPKRQELVNALDSAFLYIQPYGGENWVALNQMKTKIIGGTMDQIYWPDWESLFFSFPEAKNLFASEDGIKEY